MQLDLNLIYDKINKGIKDSVESLQDYPHELRLDDRRETIAEFFSKDSITEERLEIVDFNDLDHYKISDHLICKRGKGKGLYLAGIPYDSSRDTGFFLRLNKISATECECIVEEKVSLTSNDGTFRLYEDDHKIHVRDLSYHELIDLLSRIRQCAPENLMQSMFPIMLDSRKLKFSKIFNVNGEIKDEYKDENIYDLIEKNIPLEIFRDELTRPSLLADTVPLMNRGWSKSYKFTIDISDAIIILNESQKRSIPLIESRIREVLIEKIPRSVEIRVINNLDLSEIAENIAMHDARCELGLSTRIDDEDGDIETMSLRVLEERPRDNIIFGTSDGVKQVVQLLKAFNRSDRLDLCRFRLFYDTTIDGQDNYIIVTDGHLTWLDDVVEDTLKEHRLGEDWYDMVREEIFSRYQKTRIYKWDSEIEFDIDFSDLFED